MVSRLPRSIWFTVFGGITSFQLKLAEPQTGCLNQAKTSEMIIAVATMTQNHTQQFQWGIRPWRFSKHRSEWSSSDSPDSESATACGEYFVLAMPSSAAHCSVTWCFKMASMWDDYQAPWLLPQKPQRLLKKLSSNQDTPCILVTTLHVFFFKFLPELRDHRSSLLLLFYHFRIPSGKSGWLTSSSMGDRNALKPNPSGTFPAT